MHAGLGLQPAIGVVAADLDGGGFDAGFFALGLFEIFDLEAVLLGPARVHAQQHLGPVLAFGAAGAGMNLEIGIEPVGLARQQRFRARGARLPSSGAFSAFSASATTPSSFSASPSSIISILSLELALDLADAVRAHPPARCAPASASGPSGDRSRDWDLRRACSARRGVPWIARRQRCLLSSPTDCLISSTRRSTSARMVSRSAVQPLLVMLAAGCNGAAPQSANGSDCCAAAYERRAQ